ncbi:TPA: hypothetical protein ACG8Z1_001882, partial [Enterococcus faecium]
LLLQEENEKKLFLAVSFYLSNKEWKNASSRLIDNSYKITQKNRVSRSFFGSRTKTGACDNGPDK